MMPVEGFFMFRILAAILNLVQFVYTAWHCAWWNYHCGRARMHDDRMKVLDPGWREKI